MLYARFLIFDAYMFKLFKKGVYDCIKKEYNPDTRKTIKRRYFSGGLNMISSPVTHMHYNLSEVSLFNSLSVAADIEFVQNGKTSSSSLRALFFDRYSSDNDLKKNLREKGYAVFAAKTKKEGLAKFNEKKHDLVVIYDDMPNSKDLIEELQGIDSELTIIYKICLCEQPKPLITDVCYKHKK
ncbi:MAG: hypothetical protein ABIH08_03005 [Candidatus Omnitrophota bacterium]